MNMDNIPELTKYHAFWGSLGTLLFGLLLKLLSKFVSTIEVVTKDRLELAGEVLADRNRLLKKLEDLEEKHEHEREKERAARKKIERELDEAKESLWQFKMETLKERAKKHECVGS